MDWKRNLVITWFGCFLTGASFSLVMPFLPLYIEMLGVKSTTQATFYSGLAFALTTLASALIAPVWGRMADLHGRKLMMVRASAIMTLTIGGLGFVPNVWILLLLRLLNGLFSGYIPNATAMIASQVPRSKSGYALGTLATGSIAGSLIGPLIGGGLAQMVGMREVFYITGLLLLIVTLLTVFFVHEDFEPVKKGNLISTREILAKIPNRQILYGLFVTSMILQIATQSIEPFVTLYVRYLSPNLPNLVFFSGVIVSCVGFSSLMSSTALGKLGDRIGNHRLILIGLVWTFIVYLPMSMIHSALMLGILRFLLGFGTGALMPSVNSLLSKITPREGISRIFAYNQTFSNLGMVVGSLVGSTVAGAFSFRAAIVVTTGFIVVNLIWSFINFRKFLGKRSLTE
ncbi:multidrug efflux MFS transporter [Lactovum odontotermitis]